MWYVTRWCHDEGWSQLRVERNTEYPMLSQMNPWVVLVLGILIGWVLEWLLELFFFRRQRLSCQHRLADLEAALVERQHQIDLARTRIKSLEGQSAKVTARVDARDVALRGAVPDIALGAAVQDVSVRATAPGVSVKTAVPDVDPGVAVADVDLKATVPDVHLGVAVPDVDLEAAVPDVDLGVAVPDVDLGVAVPDVSLKAAVPDVDLGVAVPDVDLKAAVPDVDVGGAVPALAAGAVAGMAPQRLGAGFDAARMITCPQDLSRIDGIGTVFEQRLYNAGIGSFWGLAQANDDYLRGILESLFEVDLPAIKADAMRLAEQTGTVGHSWDGTQPDDFEPFPGIGEVYESRLYEAGICTYRALAGCSVDQLQAICKAPEWRRPPYAAWIARAEQLAGQKG